MLADSLVEEFEIREDEPWYDQQDLQQGEPGPGSRGGGGGRVREGVQRAGRVREGAVGNRRGGEGRGRVERGV